MNHPYRLLLFFFIEILLASCGVTPKNIDLRYTPTISELDCFFPCKDTKVYVANLVDTRENCEELGALKNSRGDTSGWIKTEDSVANWATVALKQELKGAGYHVIEEKTNACLTLYGQMIDLDCSGGSTSCESCLSIHLVVKQGENTVLDKVYKGTYKQSNFFNTKTEFSETIEKSLRKTIRQIVTDLSTKIG
jgi:uncharacterized lipoprotein YajG